MVKFITLMVLCCLAVLGGHGQGFGGRVVKKDSDLGIVGASVRLAPGGKMVATDSLGRFVFSVPSGKYMLEVSAVGFGPVSREVLVPVSGDVVVYLSEAVSQLAEVVVSTGYQKLSRERATGSFSQVSGEVLNQQIGTGIISRLEGIAPSLSVDRRSLSGSLMVRGLSTLQGDRSPLIVVDDFPYAGNIANINPNDVESITILKDAAASSIWGAKGGNGVIVITTKKGAFNRPVRANFNTSMTVLADPTFSEYDNISASDHVALERELFSRGYYASQENSLARVPLSPAVELLILFRDSKISRAQLDQQLGQLSNQDIVQNYREAFLSRGINSQHYMDLGGGSSVMNWLVSSGLDQNSSELGAGYRRINVKGDATLRIGERLELGLGLYLTSSKSTAGRPPLSSISTSNGILPPYTQFMGPDGSALAVMRNYRDSYTSSLSQGLLDWKYYPLTDYKSIGSVSDGLDVLGSLRLGYEVFDGLKASINYQHEQQRTDGMVMNGMDSYYVRNLVNQFTTVNGSTLSRALPYGAIRLDSRDVLSAHNLRGQLGYEKTLGSFALSGIAGGELRSAVGEGLSSTTYGVDEQTLRSVGVDYVGAYKNLVTGSNANIPYGNEYRGTAARYLSTYFSASVDYKGRYTLSGSLRRDASNLFGVATNNLWNPLWSIGGAWLLSAEKWMDTPLLPYARLRATYGSSGNSDSRNAAVTTITYSGNSVYTRTPFATFLNYANPELRWETVRTINLGGDFRWLGDRLSLSVDYYVKRSFDLIGNQPIDYTGGIGTVASRNAAQISARGLDLEIASAYKLGGFKINSSAFLNFYKDRVDEYFLPERSASNFVNGNLLISGVVGMPVYSVYGYKWAGLNPQTGSPMGYVNGVVSEDYATITGPNSLQSDLGYSGPAFPTLSGALRNSISWKGLNLDFNLSYKFGHVFRRPSLDYNALFSLRRGNREYSTRWQRPGDELVTNVPSLLYPNVAGRDSFYTFSQATIISADYVRLQYVGLGYTLEQQKVKWLPFKAVVVRAVASDLGLLWRANKLGLDPEYPGAVPVQNYSFNLQIKL